jgi:hypothetical protein
MIFFYLCRLLTVFDIKLVQNIRQFPSTQKAKAINEISTFLLPGEEQKKKIGSFLTKKKQII